jgi:26S proteasome regulatory subunit T3
LVGLREPAAHRCGDLRADPPGSNYVVRILSTLDRELLKPSSTVALHRHSNALVDILPPEADSSISMLGADEKPDIKYSDVGGLDAQKQEIREAVELPLQQVSKPRRCARAMLCIVVDDSVED